LEFGALNLEFGILKTMEPNQYKYMFEVEDHHWWYVGNHENFLSLLHRKNILKDGINVLDAGCGTGKWLEILKQSNKITETGIDYEEIALEFARTRGNLNLRIGDINQCIFKESSFDLITSFDVICNTNVDDSVALKNLNFYLKEDGYLLLTLPAFQFLHSKHDEMVHQNKRYRKKQLKKLIENNGFEVVKISYCVHLLFPVAILKRVFDKIFSANKEDHNEVKLPSTTINQIFLAIMRFENFLFRFISFPFGLSVLVLAKKRSS